MNLINKYNYNLDNEENLIINTRNEIIGTNATEHEEGLKEGCILIADNRAVEYLKCFEKDNKKVYIVSDKEIEKLQSKGGSILC